MFDPGQSMSLDSPPLQFKSSSQIWPFPLVKPVVSAIEPANPEKLMLFKIHESSKIKSTQSNLDISLTCLCLFLLLFFFFLQRFTWEAHLSGLLYKKK